MGLEAVIAKGMVSPNPTDKAAGALAFAMKGVETLTKVATGQMEPEAGLNQLVMPARPEALLKEAMKR